MSVKYIDVTLLAESVHKLACAVDILAEELPDKDKAFEVGHLTENVKYVMRNAFDVKEE